MVVDMAEGSFVSLRRYLPSRAIIRGRAARRHPQRAPASNKNVESAESVTGKSSENDLTLSSRLLLPSCHHITNSNGQAMDRSMALDDSRRSLRRSIAFSRPSPAAFSLALRPTGRKRCSARVSAECRFSRANVIAIRVYRPGCSIGISIGACRRDRCYGGSLSGEHGDG